MSAHLSSDKPSPMPRPHAAPPARWIRPAVQAGFLASVLLVGWQFHRFVAALGDPAGGPLPERPASVEAWLPISSLMGLTHLVKTGHANAVHPAGLVLFCLTVVLAVAMRRGFCSWVCPIGTLSEYAHKAGAGLLGRNLSMPRWLDVGLRSVRYLLLGFFLYAILPMPATALDYFIHGPYNRMADVKMYVMFAELSRLSFWVLVVLVVLSVLFRNFWCRYLCPYGALLGLCSLVSPLAVRRDEGRCTGCGRCGKACPNLIAVPDKAVVRSVECTACYRCVSACPAAGALRVAPRKAGRAVGAVLYGAITVGAFVLVPQAARAVGYWQSETSGELYRLLFAQISQIEHPRTPRAARAVAPPAGARPYPRHTAVPDAGGPDGG